MTSPTDAAAELDHVTLKDLPSLLLGSDTTVPTLHGPKKYINFDNAASTPTFTHIAGAVTSFLRWYSNVHRGTGFKSQLSSWAFEQSRDMVADFVGADLDRQVVIFTKNSTEAINKLANRLPFGDGDIILTTLMEHHSNELPWRRVGRVEHIGLNDDGTISADDFLSKLKRFGKRVRLVAITGASNVTGYINDLDFFARETHRAGAKILVDAAQLAPHRPMDVKPHDRECRIDYLVFSAHKVYAPFGVGVLVGEKETFEQGDPEEVGGGVVDIVTLEDAYWTDLPEKEEAGTPDIIGVVALARVIRMIQSIGWDEIIRHESQLTAYALRKLKEIPEVTLYGSTDPDSAAQRLGVISLNVGDVPHALVAAILSYEGAIGVRSGCFCAHLYVKSLLHVTEEDSRKLEQEILSRDRSHLPGTIRMSFGIYNTIEEIDRFIEMIKKIAAGDYYKGYVMDKEKGEYMPEGFDLDFRQYYSL
ncbi:MAG: aminotransferase class V-fold PLP-dependent enzyme [Candidatus Zixiibacteriota bacterium]|nr:MAG: aminotransferase class V-fold PLP-dependent enzyme [candidate division Zixibacteria bacterium]